MKNIKYLIILLVMILIIILIMLVAVLNRKKSQEPSQEESELLEWLDNVKEEIPAESAIELERANSIATFIQADNFINNFFDYILEKNENIPNNKAAYDVLDEGYKQENNITEENILDFFSKYKDMISYTTTNMYEEQYMHREEFVNIFLYIEGKVRNEETSEDVYILLKEDLTDDTYSIEFTSKEKFEELTSQTYITETSIPKTEYNAMQVMTVSDYDMCLAHFRNYLNILRNNREEAYDLLDETYREKRFGNFEGFRRYIEENIDYVNRTGFTEYGVATTEEGYQQYVCRDNYGYTYVFTEEYPMEYTLQLDTYTIETEQFKEKYDEAKEDRKAQINVQKFIFMINNQDYANAYAKLDDTYKQTYFNTQGAFENYVKENMFKYNNIVIQKTEKIGDTYIFTVNVTDLSNGIYKDDTKEGIESYSYSIVVQLLEGTDFVMSFSKV